MKNIKWIIVFLLALVVNVNSAEAANGVSIYIDGEHQTYSDLAVIENGRTLVPLRGIFESLDTSVRWDQETKTVTAYKGNTEIWIKIGSVYTKVNGETIKISVPAQVQNGRTLVPLRFISESLGTKVGWNNTTKTVTITSTSNVKPRIPVVDQYTNSSSGIQYTVFEDGVVVGAAFEGYEDKYGIQKFYVGLSSRRTTVEIKDLLFNGYNIQQDKGIGDLYFDDEETKWMENYRLPDSFILPYNGDIESGYVYFYDTPYIDEVYMKTSDRFARIYSE